MKVSPRTRLGDQPPPIDTLLYHVSLGSITELHFPSRSHLISASEDGTIAIFHARDWVVLRVLKGHKGRINSIGIHPSGKVALSVGVDKTLRMWDLMRGKGSASTKLGKGMYVDLHSVHLRADANFVRGRESEVVDKWEAFRRPGTFKSRVLRYSKPAFSFTAAIRLICMFRPESCVTPHHHPPFSGTRCQIRTTPGNEGRDPPRWCRRQEIIGLPGPVRTF